MRSKQQVMAQRGSPKFIPSFDFVICDIKMPKVSGLDVLASVIESSPNIPVIMISAFGTIDTAIQAMKQGAYDYMMKPFKQDEIF
jgi:DNA-binding NtrC family response regulator